MQYEGKIVRPPTEANSFLLQVTTGCSHNKCTFCNYCNDRRFSIRPYEDIEADILEARRCYPYDPPVFLVNGNPLAVPFDMLKRIMEKIREVFPESEHTNMYSRFTDVDRRSVEELRQLRELGFKMTICGLESGSDQVLRDVNKSMTSQQAIRAGQKLNEAGISYASSIMLGIGGVKNSDLHVKETILVINEMEADRVSLGALGLQSDTVMYEQAVSGEFEVPTYRQLLNEQYKILEGFDPKKPTGISAWAHFPFGNFIRAVFPYDKEKVLQELRRRENHFEPVLDRKLLLDMPI